eukprot:3712646-Pyramimonas_sp.AAC.1
MLLSPWRRAHSFLQATRFHGVPCSTYQTWCVGEIQNYESAELTLVRRVEVTGIPFWHDSGSSRRNTELIRGVGVPRIMFWQASGSASDCTPTKEFLQWR